MYDITIVGSGVASLFLALTLSESKCDQQILILEKGKALSERSCDIDQTGICDCDDCDKYVGFAGLGKSEGKFNYASGFGGELSAKVGEHALKTLLQEVDDIICHFGGDQVQKYSTLNKRLNKKAASSKLDMLTTEVRHLGSGLSTEIFQRIYDTLIAQPNIDILFEHEITQITKKQNGYSLITNKGHLNSKQLVIATGRSGTAWLEEQCASLGIKRDKTRLDLGVRVEMNEQPWRSILQDTFETKLALTFNDRTSTTYCMNPRGKIIRKYQEGLVMPDGQNFREKNEKTTNVNFTLFTPAYFATLQEANQYARKIIGGINNGGDRIVVQRVEDFFANRPTKQDRLLNNQIQPTLEADPGNLLEEVPSIYTDILKEFLTRLKSFLGTDIHGDTLLYGLDGKFYSPIIETDHHFQTNVDGLYVIGDCSGMTSSLSQAAASGVYLGEILKRASSTQ